MPKKSRVRICVDICEAKREALMLMIDELITDLNGTTVFSKTILKA